MWKLSTPRALEINVAIICLQRFALCFLQLYTHVYLQTYLPLKMQ